MSSIKFDAEAIRALANILTNTGLEVESVEVFESVPGGLEGVVIGEIVECRVYG